MLVIKQLFLHEPLESGNKMFKKFREQFARKGNRRDNLFDVFWRVLAFCGFGFASFANLSRHKMLSVTHSGGEALFWIDPGDYLVIECL